MDLAQSLLRGTFIASSVYNRKEKRFQINDLSVHLQKLEKGEQMKPKVRRRKVVIKIRVKINEIVNRKMIEKINKTQAGSLR